MSLYDERAGLVAQMRQILDEADAANRDLTAEESQKYEKIEQDVSSLDEKIEAEEAAVRRRQRLDYLEASTRTAPRTRLQTSQTQGDDGAQLAERQMKVFANYLRSGGRMTYQDMQEAAALQMDSDTGGGVLVMPEQFVMSLIDGLDEAVAIRQVATTYRVPNADSLGAPSLDTDPDDADWTVELASGSLDSSMAFGKRQLHPHPVAKRIKVSKTLLRRSSMPVDQIVRGRLLFKMAVTHEKAFMSGTGAGRPLGVFTASADGITTARDVSTDNTTTAITADGLINAKYTLKEQYLRSANLRWVFHRDAIKQIRKLKDGNGQYLWTPGMAGDRQGTIIDIPYIVSEFAPNTFTTGQYVGIIGDFSYYWIADALDPTIEVASELYMETNQDGYFIRSESDGMPVLAEAFARVKLA